jgi:ABC-type glutathione transport system ATPase component
VSLRVEQLTVGYGERRVVEKLSFELRPGGMLALIGRSGCGKSSVISAIARLLPKNARVEGRVELNGQNLFELDAAALLAVRRRTLAVVFQEPGLALDPLMRAGKQIAEVAGKERVLPALLEMDFEEPAVIARSFPHQLSGGQRQRVLIAMALARDPSFVLLDEPTAQLDAITRATILAALLRRTKEKGCALLFATHDLELAERFCETKVELS